MNKKFFVAFALVLFPFLLHALVHKQLLDCDWKFRQSRTLQWRDATAPGTVHTDLMAHQLIPDPFIGLNEREVQWVDKEDWIYETSFDLDRDLAPHDNINIAFEGLDTYADVYLNDSLIINADNMFRLWEAPVKDLLRAAGNTLRVYFHSPIKVDLPKFESLQFQYDAGNDQSQNGGIFNKRVSVFARKAGYHYGWDWGPRIVTSGIWRPVYLKAWSGPMIADAFITTKSLDDNCARMNASVEVISDCDLPDAKLIVSDLESGRSLGSRSLSLVKGSNKIEVPFAVKHPRLWWCNGMGEPSLYDFGVALSVGSDVADTKSVVTGIRTIEVVREDDAGGRTFYFRLNGVPVFAKGANYIPCDIFLPRVTHDVYKRTVKDAVDANMNMLRVWGGGVYEDDAFYNLCDSLGIMVWQDFMFACSLYPSEGAMLDNIRSEAMYNVRRLRNHPAVSIWCGNNECLEAWYNWGLKRRYEKQGVADIIWKQYVDLFHKVLPDVVHEYCPDVFYWPSSPYSSMDGSPDPDKGDSHLWRVWGGGEPVDVYNQVRSRFFSEYGFQSFPEWHTVLKYAPDSTQHFIDSDVMLAHQRAGAGANRKLESYLLDSYPAPTDFKSFLYMTQVLQADAIRTAIESHRRNRPYCMGSLFWQHNDCWPVASWSSRDYYGQWKAQHYIAKKAFDDIMLSTVAKGDAITLFAVSDRRKPVKGTLKVEAFRFDGTKLSEHSRKITLAACGVATDEFRKSEIFGDSDSCSVFLLSTFIDGSRRYENILIPSSQKVIKLEKPEITIDLREIDRSLFLDISADTFVRAFALSFNTDQTYFLHDNYFDLLPGRTYSVQLTTDMDKEHIMNSLKWTSLYHATH